MKIQKISEKEFYDIIHILGKKPYPIILFKQKTVENIKIKLKKMDFIKESSLQEARGFYIKNNKSPYVTSQIFYNLKMLYEKAIEEINEK